jgi:transposase InsO family protein
MGIRDKPIAPGAPWRNGIAERLIGSIRRECVDHIVVLREAQPASNSAGLRTLLQRNQNAPVIEQRCAGLSPGSADWKYRIAPNPRRTSSPLRADLGFRYTQERFLTAMKQYCESFG